MTSKSKTTIYLILITIAGLALRFILLPTGINLDDAITHYVANATNFEDLIGRTIDYEFGPPLYFFLMQIWIRIFSDSSVSLAMPSVILGTLLIPLVFDLAMVVRNDKVIALTAAFFAAISPLAIFFSHEVRCYSLLAVLSVLTTRAFFASLKSKSIGSKIALFVFSTLLFYTHYVSLVYCFLLIVCYTYSNIFRESKNWKQLFQTSSVFLLSGLCFIPCLPILKEHYLHGTYWVDQLTLNQWPMVFASNLAACLPLPWLVGFITTTVLIPLGVVFLIYFIIKRKEEDRTKLRKVLASNYLVFLLMIISAASTLGFLTPFILGYCRYLMPFAPLMWINLAVFFAYLLSRKKNWIIYTSALTLLFIGISSTIEILNLAQTDRNGLRQIARDLKSKKLNDNAYLICPDFDSYTFIYFVTKEQGLKLPDVYLTYPRESERKPSKHVGYAKLFNDPTISVKLLQKIESLDKDKYNFLTVIVDDDIFDSKTMPCKTRIEELLTILSSRYKSANQPISYPTKGRSFTLYRFNLQKAN